MPLEDIMQARQEKLAILRKAGIDPYPTTCWRTHRVSEALASFDALKDDGRPIVLAGRVMAQRGHGGLLFVDLNDGTGTMQALIRKDEVGDASYELLERTLDTGDIIECSGTAFLTKREERTLQVAKWRFLAKSTRPLPEKWHGLQDVEERYRSRHLDLIFNEDVRKRFEQRFTALRYLRTFFAEHGYTEVETPILQPIPGGATARPFATHMNDLDIELFLRVAPELYLKRLTVGGMERVFEIAKCFRNEGMDREHNPEFTMLEAYAAYQDHEWLMGLTEDLVIGLATELHGKPEITYGEHTITLMKPFPRIPFVDIIKEHGGLEYDLADTDDFARKAQELGVTVEKSMTKAVLADEIYKKVARPAMLAPTFVVNHPLDLSPLSKRLAPMSEYVARFQLIVGGFELCNAFAELNDPVDQRERFEAQQARRSAGDDEAHPMDEDFVTALEHGMPAAAGIGIGVDRLVALMTGAHSLREVLLFPTMKPKSHD